MITVLTKAVLVNVSNTIFVSPCSWRPRPRRRLG